MSLYSELKIDVLYEAIKIREEIQRLEHKLDALFGNHPPSLSGVQKTARRTMSAAGRARVAAAARARWAKIKGIAAKPPVPAAKKKGGLTPESRAKLAAAMKARWAARKKGDAAPVVKKR